MLYPDFVAAIAATGLTPPREVTADGTIKRFASNGNPKDTAGWYVLFDDGHSVGTFGCWRKEIRETWHDQATKMSADQLNAHLKRVAIESEKAKAAYAKEQEETAREARRHLGECKQNQPHPYLERKRIGPHGTYVNARGSLLVPMYDPDNKIVNLERISPIPGEKKIGMPAGRRKGCFYPIGEITETILIAEGFATSATVHEATGWMTFCAFTAGNLRHVYSYVSEHFSDKRIVIAADNDQWTDGNPGLKAAQEIGCAYVYPHFDEQSDGRPTDFNDLYCRESLDTVRQAIESQLAKPAAVEAGMEPVDFFGKVDPPEMAPDMLPPVLAQFCFDQAEVMGTDPSIFALGCIVSCASVIHSQLKIQAKISDPSWTESARLWGAVVGDPSIKKTPALNRTTSRIKHIDARIADKSSRDMARFDAQMAQHTRRAKVRAKAEERGTPIGFELDEGDAPEKPPRRRAIADDITIEALGELMADNERGILIYVDELSGWLGAMDAYRQGGNGGKDRAAYLELYGSELKKIDRIGRGSITVPVWGACILGSIQPDAIRNAMKQAPLDGLMQRFMVAIGRQRKYQEINRPPVEAYRDAYNDIIERLYLADPQGVVVMSPEADAIRAKLFAYAHSLAAADFIPPPMRSHMAKWQGLFPRLCLTFHAIDALAQPQPQHPANRPVSKATAERVDRFLRGFLLHHELSFYEDILAPSGHAEHVKWIAGHILAHRLNSISRSIIKRAYKAWDKLPEWVQQATMRSLEDSGWLIAPSEVGMTQKRLQNWIVNYRVHEIYAVQAEREAEMRSDKMAAITELVSQRQYRK